MLIDLPAIAPRAVTFLLHLGVIATIAFGLLQLGRRAGAPATGQRLAGIVVAWFVAHAGLGLMTPYVGVAAPLVLLWLAVTVVGGWWLAQSAGLALTKSAPWSWLLAPHLFRVGYGVAFLVALANGQLPSEFAVAAAVGDIAVGATALAVNGAIATGTRGWRWLVVAWSAFGILDLVHVVSIANFSQPGPLQLFTTEPRVAVEQFPFYLLPTVIVPTFIVLHLITWQRALATRRPAEAKLAA